MKNRILILLRWFQQYKEGIIIALVFFSIGIATLSHYGLNIDEPIHFIRGHAYLKLLLTGKTQYSEQDLNAGRVSDWKIQQYNGSYFLQKDSGHPALNDILAAASNRIFYEKLGILGDLESYHLFEVFVSSLLVFLVFAVARKKFGVFAGVIASLSLSLYPLFLGESHFNIKDPVETAFFAGTVYFLYLGFEEKKGRFIFLSSIFYALAFGTKFNIVFLPFIVLAYLAIRYFPPTRYLNLPKLKRLPPSFYLTLFLYPIIVFGIHFATRPYLWEDPVNRFLEIAAYYRGIGTGKFYQPAYVMNGWNMYPPFFVIISTPLWILFLTTIGIITSVFKMRKEKDKFLVLLLLWFVVPILRVMWPGSSIYSGVRQIMEYLPAMAAFSGIGGLFLRDNLARVTRNVSLASLILVLSFIPLVVKLIKMHPNENVYINSLVGGLSGAVEKKIPGAAETMGNVYLQGLLWINKNAEIGARYHLPVGLGSNIPRQFERKDIRFGPHFSGMKRDGEYMLEMVSVDFPPPRYGFQYLDRFLDPVHMIEVDGVPILKIWKNDEAHTKPGFLEEIEEKDIDIEGGFNNGYIRIGLKRPALVTRLEVEHGNTDCNSEITGDVRYSPDGIKQFYITDDLSLGQGQYAKSLQSDTRFVYFFPGTEAQWLHVTASDLNLCFLQIKSAKVWSLKDIRP